MLDLVNRSSWSAGLYPGWSLDCRPLLTAVFKAVHRFDADGVLEPLVPAPPIVEADAHHGDPLKTGLREATEIAPFKQGSECYLHGTAWPPDERSDGFAARVELELADGTRWQKSLQVFGPRRWKRSLLGHRIVTEGPAEPTPLQHDSAWGGQHPEHRSRWVAGNPVGTGFNPTVTPLLDSRLPRIESGPPFMASPTQRLPVAGLGPLPGWWEPRRTEAGRPPEDPEAADGCPYGEGVTRAVHNVAPRDQRFAEPFVGGEVLTLWNLVRGVPGNRPLTLRLPRLTPGLRTVIDGRRESLDPVCDTLVIDTDERTLAMIYRAAIPATDSAGWVVLDDAGAGEGAG